MSKVAIVTDSAASLSEEMRKKYQISVVPIWIQFGDESYKEGVDLTCEEFYRKLTGDTVPTTSSPPPNDFIQVYRRLAEKARDIISIHITSQGSSTYQVASLAAETVKEANVVVYDSKTVSMGAGLLAIEAAKAAMQGLSKQQILARLDSLRDRLRAFVAIRTLKYLRKSGRVRKGQAILASILSIKPVLEIKDGVVKVVDHVRTFSRALGRVLDLAFEAVGNVPTIVAVMHANAREEAEKFAEKISQKLNVSQLIIGEVGASLAVHGGPGMIGIVLCPDK